LASQLEGVKELTASLNELGVKMAAKQLRGTVQSALEPAEHLARARMPQGTEPHKTYKGRLVSPGYAISTLHIETKIDKRTGSAVAMLGVGREAFYEVQFQELGTRFHAAQPWLVPSFVESQDAMLSAIGVELRDRVKKISEKSKRRSAQRARLARR
jgi:hypothetical protein